MIPRGPIPVVYNGQNLLAGWEASKALLSLVRPACVCLHGGPTTLTDPARGAAVTAERVRATLSAETRILVAVGCDGWLAKHRRGECTASEVVERLLDGALVADHLGSNVVWDAEEAWKVRPDNAGRIARLVLAGCATKFPSLTQYHTSYAGPCAVALPGGHSWGGHRGYPWKAWVGPASPVVGEAWQVYWAPPDGSTAPRGSGQKTLDLSRRSVEIGIAEGLVKVGMPDMAYGQLHNSNEYDIVDVALQHETWLGWACPGPERTDERGALALRILCALHAHGLWGPMAVVDFQASHNLEPDGLAGELTQAVLFADPQL